MNEIGFQLKGVLQLLTEGGSYITLVYDRLTVKAKGEGFMFTLPDDKGVTVKVSYVDAHGHPATVDGSPSWVSSDPTILVVTPDDADPFKASVVAGDNLGQAQITVRADADLGSGTRAIVSTFDVEVVGGEAVRGVIEPVGDPVPVV